jgi:CheY-like chemotaxis protein
VCRRARADARAGYTYIILAMVLGDREDVVRGMEAGADDYLIKPVGLFDLQARLIAAQLVLGDRLDRLTAVVGQVEHDQIILGVQDHAEPLGDQQVVIGEHKAHDIGHRPLQRVLLGGRPRGITATAGGNHRPDPPACTASRHDQSLHLDQTR